jgi:hypothetical protein
MEEVRTAPIASTPKYRKLISATELGEDFRDLEDKDQLQLNKKILKWKNVLEELQELNKLTTEQVKEGKWIKSPYHKMYDDWEREPAPKGEWRQQSIILYPVFNEDGTPKMKTFLAGANKVEIRRYLDSIFHLKLKMNKPLRDVVRGKYPTIYDYNKELYKEYMQTLKDNINRAIKIFNTREIELEKKQKEEAKAHQNKEIECGCGGHYSIRNKLKHFATSKHEKWAEKQEPIEPVASKPDTKYEHQNTEVQCECGGKYSIRNKLKHFATGKHTKYIESLK